MDLVSFFAGCGGLDLGFEKMGFRVVWANELEPHCRATYIRNHPNTEFVLEDICKINSDTIPNCDGLLGDLRVSLGVWEENKKDSMTNGESCF